VSFWWSLAALAVPVAAVAVSPQQRLTAAWLGGDFDELERIGAEVGSRGVRPALEADQREVTLAALAAATAVEDAWVLLLPLAETAAGPDRPLAAGASRAAVRIAVDLDRAAVLERDIPVDALQARLTAWRRLAGAPDRWPDVRVHALEIATALAAALGDDAGDADLAYDLEARLTDDEPEVRRAAAELAPQPLPWPMVTPLAEAAAGDAEPAVALAAAQALCSGLPFGDDGEPILAALGDRGLERLRALVADGDLAPVARLDGARCLVAAGGDANLEVARALAAKGPRAIRAAARDALKAPRK
jgi:hypothetical protein